MSGVGEGHRVLEPSAGTGALCTFALASGATVHANELSGRRADLLAVLLAEAGQDPAQTLTRENADHLDAILPPSVRADVVLMNPPFSMTAGRLGTPPRPDCRAPTTCSRRCAAWSPADGSSPSSAPPSDGASRRTGRSSRPSTPTRSASAPTSRWAAPSTARTAPLCARGSSSWTRRRERTRGDRGRVEAVVESVADAVDVLAPIRVG